jgi:hypothetical protein
MSTPGGYPSTGSLRMHGRVTTPVAPTLSGRRVRRSRLGSRGEEARVRGQSPAWRALGVLGALAVVLGAATGCGFANALAHPEATRAGVPIASATPVPTPAPPPPIAEADLLTSGGELSGHLVVTLGEARTGLEPPVLNTDACHFDGPSLQYVPVEFAFTSSGLAAHVAISRGPTTPPDIGDVGIFVESNNGSEVYCKDFPPLPTADKFYNQMGARIITAWVVLGRAVTPGSPDGRPEVFPTLQLRVSDFRVFSDPTAQRTLVPGSIDRGALCADDADAICVPVG